MNARRPAVPADRRTPTAGAPARDGRRADPASAAVRAGGFAVAATVLAAAVHHVVAADGAEPGRLAAVAAVAFLAALVRAGRPWSFRSVAVLMCGAQAAAHLLLGPAPAGAGLAHGPYVAEPVAVALHLLGTVAMAALLRAADARVDGVRASAGRLVGRLRHLLALRRNCGPHPSPRRAPAGRSTGAAAERGTGLLLAHVVERRGPPVARP